jgi:guanylate kinase
MSQGIAIILSGPSGVGKDTIIDQWSQSDHRVQRVVACTTRTPRPGEVDSIDYHFQTRESFQALIDQNHFLEYKEVHGNYYGTPIVSLNQMVDSGKVAILKIDVQGALQIMVTRPDILTIFLMPPSISELAQRLRARGTEDPVKIAERLKNAEFEIDHSPLYHHRVVNASVEDCVSQIQQIVESRCQP